MKKIYKLLIYVLVLTMFTGCSQVNSKRNSKKIIEEDTFEDLKDTYEFSKNHDYEREKDDFEMEI